MGAEQIAFLLILSARGSDGKLRQSGPGGIATACDKPCKSGLCSYEDCRYYGSASCPGGKCAFTRCVSPSCGGGRCAFTSCSNPEVRGVSRRGQGDLSFRLPRRDDDD
jgi:hypothetical protein